MPRPLILLLAFSLLSASLYADDPDPTKLPVVKKTLDKAEADIRRNRKAYDEANEKAFGEAEKALKAEVDRLSKAGKPEEAVAVKKLIESLRDRLTVKGEKATALRNPAQQGAVAWNGHKYKYIAEKMAWHEAKAKCETMGGYLLVIDNQAEQDFVVELFKALEAKPETVWCGVTRGRMPGEWVTVKGQKASYTNWSRGNPSNHGGRENCVEVIPPDGSLWNDRPENWPAPFICEWDD